MATEKRKSDAASASKFRTERMFQDGEYWYFYTREGSIEGPFKDLLEAKTRLEAYIRLIDSAFAPEKDKYSLSDL